MFQVNLVLKTQSPDLFVFLSFFKKKLDSIFPDI